MNYGVCRECKVRNNDSSKKELHKCPYCERFFCIKHFEPKPVYIPDFRLYSKYPEFQIAIETESTVEEKHPCFQFTRKWVEEKDQELRLQKKLFIDWLDKSKAYRRKFSTARLSRHPRRIYRRYHNYSRKPRMSRKKIIRNVTIFLFILILIGGVYHHRAFVIPTFLEFIGYEPLEISPIITPVQTPSVTPTSPPTITSQPNITDIEVAIFIYTNIERRNHGVKELIWDEKLSEIARAHSRDMVQNNFFSHINLRGEDPTARAKRYGYPLHKELGDGWYREGIAENIGKMPTGNVLGAGYVSNDADSIAKAQVESWMSSSGHRGNILDPSYDRLGVGVAYDGLYYISTQNFW